MKVLITSANSKYSMNQNILFCQRNVLNNVAVTLNCSVNKKRRKIMN